MLDHHTRSEPSIRHEWFTTAATAHGIDAGLVVGADQTADGGGAALRTLLADHPDVTAVFTFNDIIAIGALREARRLGRSVPRELAVIGFDGLQLGALVEPPLTSVALDTRRSARWPSSRSRGCCPEGKRLTPTTSSYGPSCG
jgi:DNA-binding LacI/PurR family transcriptional regulator